MSEKKRVKKLTDRRRRRLAILNSTMREGRKLPTVVGFIEKSAGDFCEC